MSPEVSGFFDAHRDLLPLYARLEEAISARHPDTRITVHKTQISFYGLRQFACVSFLRPGRAKDFPGSFLPVLLFFHIYIAECQPLFTVSSSLMTLLIIMCEVL